MDKRLGILFSIILIASISVGAQAQKSSVSEQKISSTSITLSLPLTQRHTLGDVLKKLARDKNATYPKELAKVVKRMEAGKKTVSTKVLKPLMPYIIRFVAPELFATMELDGIDFSELVTRAPRIKDGCQESINLDVIKPVTENVNQGPVIALLCKLQKDIDECCEFLCKKIKNVEMDVEEVLDTLTECCEDLSEQIEECCGRICDNLEDGFACAPRIISQEDFVGGVLEINEPGNYCLKEDVGSDITILADFVTVDLNDRTINGRVVFNASNGCVRNGRVIAPAAENYEDAMRAAVEVTANAVEARVENCFIQTKDATAYAVPARTAVFIGGAKTTIDACTIRTGRGSDGAADDGGNGGAGIYAEDADTAAILNLFILTGDGGNSAMARGGDGGVAIELAGTTKATKIRGCTIERSGNGGSGATFGGNGADAVVIRASAIDNEVRGCTLSNTGQGGLGATAGIHGRAITDFNTTIVSPGGSVICQNFAYAVAQLSSPNANPVLSTVIYHLQGDVTTEGGVLVANAATAFDNIFAQ